jgi:hypothetical protein
VLTRRGFIQRDGDFGVWLSKPRSTGMSVPSNGAHAKVGFDRKPAHCCCCHRSALASAAGRSRRSASSYLDVGAAGLVLRVKQKADGR